MDYALATVSSVVNDSMFSLDISLELLELLAVDDDKLMS